MYKIHFLFLLVLNFFQLFSQDKPVDLVVYWDVSLSMENREIEAEIEYLQQYLSNNPVSSVKLIKFNNRVLSEESFTVSPVSWEPLKASLLNCTYDGHTSFTFLKNFNKGISSLIFTDTIQTGEVYNLKGYPSVIVVNLSGKGQKGQTLTFTSQGLSPNTQENNRNQATEIALGEVVVTGEKPDANESVTTAYGTKSKESVGYAVKTINADEVTAIETDVSTALDGKVSGLNVGPSLSGRANLSKATMRGMSSFFQTNHPLIVIDGVPLERTGEQATLLGVESNYLSNYDFIDPNNIAEFTILKGLAATNRYGSKGNNGVILITTKTNYHLTAGANDNKKKFVPEYTELHEEQPSYVTDLKNEADLESFYSLYYNYRLFYKNKPEFYVNVSKILYERNEREKAVNMLLNVVELFPFEENNLRLVAFMLEYYRDYESATGIYEKLSSILPNQVQPKINIGMLLYNSKKFSEAYRILNEVKQNTNFISDDSHRFMAYNLRGIVAKDLALKNNPATPEYLKIPVSISSRIVLEWSHTDAEFDVQFIDSKKNHSNWPHSNLENNRAADEKAFGLKTLDFLIEEGPKGPWLLNIKYYGNGGDTPTFVKINHYKNFGAPNEKLETKVVALKNYNLNQNIMKFMVE